MSITKMEKWVIAAIVFLFIGLMLTVPRVANDAQGFQDNYKQRLIDVGDAAFSGYVKETGNPNGLTKEEWLALNKVQK